MEGLTCPLCQRAVPSGFVGKHHLMPRAEHGKETVKLCVDCGKQIHQLFTVHELRDRYSTIESLRNDERMQKWIRWVSRRDFGVTMKYKKRR